MHKGFIVWSAAFSGGLTLIQDLILLKNGKINNRELGVHTTRNVTETVGAVAGIEYGAMLGTSLLPGVGTIVGGFVGYVVGSRVGQTVGNGASNILFPNKNDIRQLEYNDPFLLKNQPQ
ncbi:hypothetical protein J5Y03_09000 [Bacillus sp. RG28]|uniref:Glycine zipper 2TM domain-containing protein n=1 Tax=Gottfriedia endophytica TaxID=2820819 RepID=A0A940SGQ3_9BACI|nr:hypothetical protein [Gottfriedia endophytica]MBP0725327.1 hypothetical protein [Gottfriedia endophytica]